MKTTNYKQIRYITLLVMSLFAITTASAAAKTTTLKVQLNETEVSNIDESIIATIKNDYKMLVKLPEVVVEKENQELQEIEVSDNQVYLWSDALDTLLHRMQHESSKEELYSYHK